MKIPVRILFALLCAALIAGMPFFLSSPSLLYEAEMEFYEEREEADEPLDFGRFLFSSAAAEEEEGFFSADDVELDIDQASGLSIPDAWSLGYDASVIPPEPNPDAFTENGYSDRSIRVRVETRRLMDSDVHIAFVEIAHPTQLRTATADGVKSKRTVYISSMAVRNNAVIAINGDDFIQSEADGSQKKIFEFRMGEPVPKRQRINTNKDTLIIDRNGDFHLFILGKGLDAFRDEHPEEVINAFCFGPALVMDGEVVEHREYGYQRTSHAPRSAIGQTGPLSYVLVLVEGRGGKDNGVTHAELASIMLDLGCVQAYNLDGGNSAEMIMPGPDADNKEPLEMMMYFQADQQAYPAQRAQSDIIYFATAVQEEERE